MEIQVFLVSSCRRTCYPGFRDRTQPLRFHASKQKEKKKSTLRLNLSGSTDTILQPGLGKLRGKQEKEEKEEKIKEFIVVLSKKKGKS